jgi:predicted TIM-barrel fold metal-dependent hydrolase
VRSALGQLIARRAGSNLGAYRNNMKIIGLEEHFWTPEIAAALNQPGQREASMDLYQDPTLLHRLQDLGEDRLRQMDLIGLDMMVLSVTTPATQALPPAQAVPLACQANDRLAAAIKAHPDRFAGFATLPTPDPAAAEGELHRAVQELGLRGAMIHARTADKYLDHPDYRPLLAAAREVPIYLHPQIPPQPVRARYYDGFDPALSLSFATSGWGWHLDAGVAALRLILAGVFDELPTLQIVLGHWGEMVTFFLERVNLMTASAKSLKLPVTEYYRQNFYVTPGGMFSTRYLQEAVEIMGSERVLYATDYPFVYRPDGTARHFLEQAAISDDARANIAHRNAERLLKLS